MGQDEALLTGPLIDKLSSVMENYKFTGVNKVSKQDNAFICSVILFHRKGKKEDN